MESEDYKGNPPRLSGGERRAEDAGAQHRQLPASDVSVIITGDSGTGKEVLSRFIHANSRRRDNPFVPINCQAYVDTLIESELFGYRANAFTGASAKGKPGKLELVNGGTLFLDEIGELSAAVQVKLLRAIETREIEPVGGVKAVISVLFRPPIRNLRGKSPAALSGKTCSTASTQ